MKKGGQSSTFTDIKGRKYKRIIKRDKLTDEAQYPQEEGGSYHNQIEQMLDNDEISHEEAGFLHGYAEG